MDYYMRSMNIYAFLKEMFQKNIHVANWRDLSNKVGYDKIVNFGRLFQNLSWKFYEKKLTRTYFLL